MQFEEESIEESDNMKKWIKDVVPLFAVLTSSEQERAIEELKMVILANKH
ncbi:MAG: hypothetical protein JKY55_11035 [Aliivibrio sp.]|nr:hypothetical protein [Aliivibrio sp.]